VGDVQRRQTAGNALLSALPGVDDGHAGGEERGGIARGDGEAVHGGDGGEEAPPPPGA